MKGLFSNPITYVVITFVGFVVGFVITEVIIVIKAKKHPFITKTKKNDKED